MLVLQTIVRPVALLVREGKGNDATSAERRDYERKGKVRTEKRRGSRKEVGNEEKGRGVGKGKGV